MTGQSDRAGGDCPARVAALEAALEDTTRSLLHWKELAKGRPAPDALREALRDAERFIANFVGEPDKAGINPRIALEKIRAVLSAPLPSGETLAISELIEELRHHERDYSSLIHGPLCGRAADEIEGLVKALEFIRDGYADQDVNHVDYRVKVYQVALDALDRVGRTGSSS